MDAYPVVGIKYGVVTRHLTDMFEIALSPMFSPPLSAQADAEPRYEGKRATERLAPSLCSLLQAS